MEEVEEEVAPNQVGLKEGVPSNTEAEGKEKKEEDKLKSESSEEDSREVAPLGVPQIAERGGKK